MKRLKIYSTFFVFVFVITAYFVVINPQIIPASISPDEITYTQNLPQAFGDWIIAIDEYYNKTDKNLPKTKEELFNVLNSKHIRKDDWDEPWEYVYVIQNSIPMIVITSKGPDKTLNTPDDFQVHCIKINDTTIFVGGGWYFENNKKLQRIDYFTTLDSFLRRNSTPSATFTDSTSEITGLGNDNGN